MVKTVTKICNFISVIMVLIVIAIGAVMIVPKVMGNDIYAVMSGSMEPYYHVGSVVIVDKHFTRFWCCSAALSFTGRGSR